MIKIVQIGIGPLGRKITERIAERPNMTVVSAVDTDPQLAGADLGELCTTGFLGVPVSASLQQGLSAVEADVIRVNRQSSICCLDFMILVRVGSPLMGMICGIFNLTPCVHKLG